MNGDFCDRMVASKPTAELPWPQHQDPPLLWPILVGLSVLFHLGLLAMALPLFIRIVRPAAPEITTVTVPVELLELEQTLQSQPAIATDTTPEQPAEAEPTQGEDAAQPGSTSSNPSPSASQAPAETAETSRANESPAEGNTPVPSSDSADPETKAPAVSETPAPVPEAGANDGTQPGRNRETNGSTDSPAAEDVGPLPDLGPEDLDPPSPNNQLNPESEVFVRFGSLLQLPANQVSDLPDSPPEFPPGPNQSRAIALSQYNCPGKVPPTSQDFDIQVIINRAGVIEDATIVGARFQDSALNQAEAFAVCLVRASDFRFIPARSGGAPALTDAYYLTVTVSPANP
ncbi:MAG: hypothetical protein AAF152_19855 [Cyanobacteria bacterium P01_A01_bin.114]